MKTSTISQSITEAERYTAAVTALVPMVDLWQKILITHTRTEDGYCAAKVCGEPGTGRAHVVYPCSVRILAVKARDLYHRS